MRLATILLTACLLASAGPAPANDQTGPDPDLWVHLRDDVRGDVDGSRRFCFFATSRTKLSLSLRGNDTAAAPGSGFTLQLFEPGGQELVVSRRQDASNANRDIVRWRSVRLADTGTYTLVVTAAEPGGFRLLLDGKVATRRKSVFSDEQLAPLDTATASINAVSGSILTARFFAAKGRGFTGELLDVKGPDGASLFLPENGKVTLLDDGLHEVTFRNAGARFGHWRVDLKAKPPRRPRRAQPLLVGGEVHYVPSVSRLPDNRAISRDLEYRLTLIGHDFEEGVDVRLLRKGRDDILGENIHVVSPNRLECTFDLNTKRFDLPPSNGDWKIAVFNDPQYDDAQDRTTLQRGGYLRNVRRSLRVIPAGTVALPNGVEKNTEVWQVRFISEFQEDLDRMGLGSDNAEVRNAARGVVQAYTIANLRALFRTNVTQGDVGKDLAAPVSFVLSRFQSVAGTAGEDYNVIEVGGEYGVDKDLDPDPRDAAEPLLWGHTPADPGNQTRENLTLFDTDIATVPDRVRIGTGVRTRVLDPGLSTTSDDFVTATSALRSVPLRASDRQYFVAGFRPRTTSQALRYEAIVQQCERVAREIAAIVAHHVGKAMGLANGGFGPMANPTESGDMWPLRSSLDFNEAQISELIANAVPHDLPGKSKALKIAYFPLNTTQPLVLPNILTDQFVAFEWNYVGGRVNAAPEDYRVQYIIGSHVPAGMQLTFSSLSGTPPLFLGNPQNRNLYCRAAIIDFLVTDKRNGKRRRMQHRLNILPDLNNPTIQASPALVLLAQNCINAITSQ